MMQGRTGSTQQSTSWQDLIRMKEQELSARAWLHCRSRGSREDGCRRNMRDMKLGIACQHCREIYGIFLSMPLGIQGSPALQHGGQLGAGLQDG
jgi:hypothetical protein